jgi:5'-nucleotidase
MRILIANDDGIDAVGIKLLERIALTFTEDVTVVAPDSEQSGKGRSLTLTAPIRMRRIDDRHFAVSGTPTDAVIMALGVVMKDDPPDLILSGINRGSNLGEDVSYSGTVAAAQEGALAGIRSIALSQVYGRRAPGHDVSFAAAEGWAARVLEPLLTAELAPRTLVNINFPAVDPSEVAGIKVARQGLRDYAAPDLVHGVDPRGFEYWWMKHGHVRHTQQHDTDLEAIDAGYVTVTALHLDLTHTASHRALEGLYR